LNIPNKNEVPAIKFVIPEIVPECRLPSTPLKNDPKREKIYHGLQLKARKYTLGLQLPGKPAKWILFLRREKIFTFRASK